MSEWIAQQFRRAIDQTAGGFGDWCINVQSNTNADLWVQITWDNLNLAYPIADDPTIVLASLPDVPLLDVSSWERNTCLTLSHGADESLPAIADFVAAYIMNVLGQTGDESDWSVSEEAL